MKRKILILFACLAVLTSACAKNNLTNDKL